MFVLGLAKLFDIVIEKCPSLLPVICSFDLLSFPFSILIYKDECYNLFHIKHFKNRISNKHNVWVLKGPSLNVAEPVKMKPLSLSAPSLTM